MDKVLNNFFIDWGKLEKLSKGEFLSTIWNHVIQALPKGLCVAQATDFLGVNQVIHINTRTLTITTNLINSLTIKLHCAHFRCARAPRSAKPAKQLTDRRFGPVVLDCMTLKAAEIGAAQERTGRGCHAGGQFEGGAPSGVDKKTRQRLRRWPGCGFLSTAGSRMERKGRPSLPGGQVQRFRSTASGTSNSRSLAASATQGSIQPSAFSSRVSPGHSIW